MLKATLKWMSCELLHGTTGGQLRKKWFYIQQIEQVGIFSLVDCTLLFINCLDVRDHVDQQYSGIANGTVLTIEFYTHRNQKLFACIYLQTCFIRMFPRSNIAMIGSKLTNNLTINSYNFCCLITKIISIWDLFSHTNLVITQSFNNLSVNMQMSNTGTIWNHLNLHK